MYEILLKNSTFEKLCNTFYSPGSLYYCSLKCDVVNWLQEFVGDRSYTMKDLQNSSRENVENVEPNKRINRWFAEPKELDFFPTRNNDSTDQVKIYFIDEKDAMLFKLTWF